MTSAQQLAARKLYGSGGGTKTSPSYIEQEVMEWSPEKIILKTYDLFLVSVGKRDVNKMNKSLAALMESINFDMGEEAGRLFRLYEYAQRLVIQRRYEEAAECIRGLRQSWNEAFKIE